MNEFIMPAAAARFNHVIAFDVAKESLAVHILPSGESLTAPNTPASARRLLRREQKRSAKLGLGPLLAVCEATGGYENAVLEAACELGLACHRAHGSSVRAYAKFRGRHAKNDPIDGCLIAEYGRDKPDLRLYQPPRPEQAALRELMGRRTELQDMIGAEQNRMEHVSVKAVRQSLEKHLKMLNKELLAIEKEIEALAASDAALRHRAKLMQTVTGVGPVTAYTLLAFMPELGSIPASTAAALAGRAPYDRDSGKERGRRRIFAGRGQVRACLFMAARAAIQHHEVFSTFAQRLTKKGKPYKVVVTAVMRKIVVILSAMLKADEPWKHAKTA
ncbi:MAG: IS110 family transposase [Rhodomicrobium sp.]